MQSIEEISQPKSIGHSGSVHLVPGNNVSATLHIEPAAGRVLLNGIPIDVPHSLNWGQEYLIKTGPQFFLAKGCSDSHEWLSGLQLDRWILQDLAQNKVIDSIPLHQVAERAQQLGLDPNNVITTVQGAEHSVYLRDMLASQEPIRVTPDVPPAPELPTQSSSQAPSDGQREEAIPISSSELLGEPESTNRRPRVKLEDTDSEVVSEEDIEINTVSGEFTCPHCWQHFDRGDVMWVAKHPGLRDPELGDEFPLRFFPTSFDELGRAIDGMGVRCTDMACPNCRSRLPPQFLDLPCHIFSIVGAPSAGKSYFLTSMINQLEESLPINFGLSFQDGDASGNALLSNMRARLFSDSSRPEEIALDKTVPGGEMFRTWEREGRRIKLPKPFTYLLAPFGDIDGERESLHLVFYDNAGEQFEPAERSEAAESTDEDATRHLATSDAIFFLYDPATNVKFRKKLAGKDDPQVNDEKFLKLNRQDNIIAEMRIRIKSELYLDAGERLESPLAMIVGKCDLWADLLDAPLVDPVTPDGLSLEIVAKNSDLIRKFLLSTSPGVVGNAEAISREVIYFPVSPIGHSPRPFKLAGGSDERIGPVPGKVNPIQVEVPVIWALARLHPEIVPVSTANTSSSETN
ncbi:hypothetical protein N9L71_06600 [Verrucomicrobiales bacterium]|nr:hypothetical protein [Verrucomicrobiales bacterium]